MLVKGAPGVRKLAECIQCIPRNRHMFLLCFVCPYNQGLLKSFVLIIYQYYLEVVQSYDCLNTKNNVWRVKQNQSISKYIIIQRNANRVHISKYVPYGRNRPVYKRIVMCHLSVSYYVNAQTKSVVRFMLLHKNIARVTGLLLFHHLSLNDGQWFIYLIWWWC